MTNDNTEYFFGTQDFSNIAEAALNAFKNSEWQLSANLYEQVVEGTYEQYAKFPIPNKDFSQLLHIYLCLYCSALSFSGKVEQAILVVEKYRNRFLNLVQSSRSKLDVDSQTLCFPTRIERALNACAKEINPMPSDVISPDAINQLSANMQNISLSKDRDYFNYLSQRKEEFERRIQDYGYMHGTESESYEDFEKCALSQAEYDESISIKKQLLQLVGKHRPAGPVSQSKDDPLKDFEEYSRKLSTSFMSTSIDDIKHATKSIFDTQHIMTAPSEQAIVYFICDYSHYSAIIVLPGAKKPLINVDLPDSNIEFLSDTVQILHLAAREKFKSRTIFQSNESDNRETLILALNAIWKQVVGPVIEQLKKSNITSAVFIPTGPVSHLPLHAAISGNSIEAPFANELVSISYAPSARLLNHAKHICSKISFGQEDYKGERYFGMTGVGNPEPSGFHPLKFAEAELDIVSSRFFVRWGSNWVSPRVLKDHNAMRFSMPGILNGEYGEIVHIACHAEHDPEIPLRSGIFLSNDEKFSVSDILRTSAETRLTVLSCCETGLSSIEIPSESISLPSILMAAGHAGILSTYWPVYDFSSAMLLVRFYYEWLDCGQAPVDALARTQKWLVRSEKREMLDFFSDSQAQNFEDKVPDDHYKKIINHYKMLRKHLKKTRSFDKYVRSPVNWAGHYLTGV